MLIAQCESCELQQVSLSFALTQKVLMNTKETKILPEVQTTSHHCWISFSLIPLPEPLVGATRPDAQGRWQQLKSSQTGRKRKRPIEVTEIIA